MKAISPPSSGRGTECYSTTSLRILASRKERCNSGGGDERSALEDGGRDEGERRTNRRDVRWRSDLVVYEDEDVRLIRVDERE